MSVKLHKWQGEWHEHKYERVNGSECKLQVSLRATLGKADVQMRKAIG